MKKSLTWCWPPALTALQAAKTQFKAFFTHQIGLKANRYVHKQLLKKERLMDTYETVKQACGLKVACSFLRA
jgi:hypothetical protein